MKDGISSKLNETIDKLIAEHDKFRGEMKVLMEEDMAYIDRGWLKDVSTRAQKMVRLSQRIDELINELDNQG